MQKNPISTPPLILGIDPGFTGALALYDPNRRALIRVWDMPTKVIMPAGKRLVDSTALGIIIDAFASQIAFAVIEDVHAMPEQGVVSVFRFGQALGVLEGALGSFLIPSTKATPAVWKACLGVTHDKSTSLKKAQALFPLQKQWFLRKKDDGRAEAALIAVYGSLFLSKIRR